MCSLSATHHVIEQNGVIIEVSSRGFYERATRVSEIDWFTPDDPEFYALVAQFNGQTFHGTAW